LEYQGEIHYFDIPIYGNLGRRQKNDKHKVAVSADMGITVIQIPFWWDKSPQSLISTIKMQRPDLLQHYPSGKAIPTTVPSQIPTARYLQGN
jgi:hypothetical protein